MYDRITDVLSNIYQDAQYSKSINVIFTKMYEELLENDKNLCEKTYVDRFNAILKSCNIEYRC